jgi:hypothetical protein
MYAFEKLYMDLVTDDGTVCIVYLTWTEVMGMRQATAGYELYTPDGRREVVHARRPAELPDLQASEWRLELDVPGGPVEVRHTARSDGWTPATSFPSVAWSVKTARADVEMRWLGDAGRPTLRGHGYADWVSLHKITRRLGMRRVDWGRAHVGDQTVVWNRIHPMAGEAWTRALVVRGTQRTECEAIELAAGGDAVAVTGADGVARKVLLGAGRVIHDGPALDKERLPSAVARNLAKLVSPPIDETRWVRRARMDGEAGEGWALLEHVRFGSDRSGA